MPEHPFGLVVFVHGSGSNRHSPRNRYVARELQNERFATLLLDLLALLVAGRDVVGDLFRSKGVRPVDDAQPRDMGMAIADLRPPEPDPELEIREDDDIATSPAATTRPVPSETTVTNPPSTTKVGRITTASTAPATTAARCRPPGRRGPGPPSRPRTCGRRACRRTRSRR